MTNAQTLLEAYAPVLCFNEGEEFLPTRVDTYLHACRLCRHIPVAPDADVTAQWEALGRTGLPRPEALGEFSSARFYLQLVTPTWGERLTPIFYAIVLALFTATGWAMRGLSGAAAAASAAIVLIVWMRVASAKNGSLLLFTALFLLIVSALIGLALRPLSNGLAVICAGALLVWLGLGFVSAYWGQLPGLFIRASSKLNQRRRDAARDQYRAWQRAAPAYPYYGRVVREGRWTTLQYHYFYAFNDWAHQTGLNYHEGDWETVMVFLKDGDPQPYGVGYSAHHQGEFRRWADAEKVAGSYHPQVYVAIGSHANYPHAGVILPEALVPAAWGGLVRFFGRVKEAAEAGVARAQGQTQVAQTSTSAKPMRRSRPHPTTIPLSDPQVQKHQSKMDARQKTAASGVKARAVEDLSADRISFQETALGTGPHIGFLSQHAWEPVILTEPLPGWVEYRGLWGVRAWMADESGPPGPKWDRPDLWAQFPRLRWAKPLLWLQQLEAAAPPQQPPQQ